MLHGQMRRTSYLQTYKYEHTPTCIHICAYFYSFIYIYIDAVIHIYTYLLTYLHTCILTYIHIYIYTYLYTYIHTYITHLHPTQLYSNTNSLLMCSLTLVLPLFDLDLSLPPLSTSIFQCITPRFRAWVSRWPLANRFRLPPELAKIEESFDVAGAYYAPYSSAHDEVGRAVVIYVLI